ncbi:serine hydrolase domain-containing protein [Mariniphaga sediminis]|jgi:CubicO group peptidase (beta-lactamase class C family)|uniref:serine hydrolase domain-containing protein n=1 Tax=Mariniphaga sediminis TaxID=1628158 RepID=UPI0011C3CE02|nr:serine hydrolase domain-containing protein [Mariniphaga sediminis]
METFHIPASSVAIIEDGQVAMMKAYGLASVEHQILNTKETAFQLASATKLISATAIMTLVQEGRLDLNQKIRHYLPELPERRNDMEVLDLLAHQSGIVGSTSVQHFGNSGSRATDGIRLAGNWESFEIRNRLWFRG